MYDYNEMDLVNMFYYSQFIKLLVLNPKDKGKYSAGDLIPAFAYLYSMNREKRFDARFAFKVFMSQYGGKGVGKFPGFKYFKELKKSFKMIIKANDSWVERFGWSE